MTETLEKAVRLDREALEGRIPREAREFVVGKHGMKEVQKALRYAPAKDTGPTLLGVALRYDDKWGGDVRMDVFSPQVPLHEVEA